MLGPTEAAEASGARRLFDAAPMALCQLEGPDLVLRAANEAARTALGLEAVELGRPTAELLGSRFDPQALAALGAVVGANVERRFLQRTMDPDAPELGGVYDFLARPDVDGSGEVRGVLLFGRPMSVPSMEPEPEPGQPAAPPLPPDRALQSALLPGHTPIVPHLQVCAHVTVSPAGGAGGDWFETVALPDDRCALVVGDVVGRGYPALSALAQLRAVAGNELAEGVPVTEVVDHLDGCARRVTGGRGSTVAIVVVDPATGGYEVAQRGHVAPVVVTPDGHARQLEVSPSPPLGVPGSTARHTGSLRDGDVMVLFTDGLVARTDATIESGLARLCRGAAHAVASRPDLPLAELNRRLADSVSLGLGRPEDDATVLSARFTEREPPALDVTTASAPDDLPAVRTQVAAWLEDVSSPEDQAFALVHAVAEAVARAGTAAHGPAELRVRGRLGVDGIARVTVSSGRPVMESPERARPDSWVSGLVMMLELVDDVSVDEDGRSVTLSKALGCPTVFVADEGGGDDGILLLDAFLVREGAHRVLMVRGPVDLSTVEDLRLAVVAAARPGEPLRLDLTGVNSLRSAGVTLLHTLLARGQVVLRAAHGSPASTVMRITALPFESVPAG